MIAEEKLKEQIQTTICCNCDDVGDWEVGQSLAEAQEYCRKKAICAYCTDLTDQLVDLITNLVVEKIKE